MLWYLFYSALDIRQDIGANIRGPKVEIRLTPELIGKPRDAAYLNVNMASMNSEEPSRMSFGHNEVR